ncbi:PAS domain S-box protein [bacterium]|nr:MAG: PAS domain S-box protein [bacterium]
MTMKNGSLRKPNLFARNPSIAARYTFTVVVVTLATLLRFALTPVLGQGVPFILYFPTVVLCAWFGGLWQGLLSTALGGIISWYVFIPPPYSFRVSDPTAPAQLIIFLIAGALISLLAESLHRSRRIAEARKAKEQEQRERLRVTLESIGDAVIATNAEAQVTFLNPVAESLTGWSQREAKGLPLEEIFKIVNEQTRAGVENPALRAMREGVIVGLANHTALIAKDGMERPIDDSGAPIKDAEGKILGAVLIFRDITERRAAEEQLRLIIETSPIGKVMIDEEGRIILVNSQAEQLFGYTREELIGQFVEALVPERFRRQHGEDRAGFAQAPQAKRMGAGRDLFGLRKDGREVPIEIGLNPIKVKKKVLVLSSVVDITERKQAEGERARLLASAQAAREQAEAASRAKDKFVAMVSHEIRTPLNAILGWAQLLRTDKYDKEETARALETIERNAKAQAQLIDDLLDISRIITGKMNLDIQPVEPTQIIEEAIDSIRLAAEAKSIELHVRLEPRGALVSGDPNRLQQIVWNLLSNAVKFTPRHGRIVVSVERIDSQLQLTVSDSGEGISPEFLPYVFDRFSQANAGSERKHGGLGLGLAIVRHLTELHGGTVRAESQGEGQGAIFTVTLPVRVVRERMGEPEGAEIGRVGPLADAVRLSGLRVMIVDDEAETRELLIAMLTQTGAEVKACASAAEALEAIERWRPSVLISDIGMPNMDGYALIKKLRAREPERGGSIPAVALTAYARSEDCTRALAAGFQMHVPKPVQAEELTLVIASLFGRTDRRMA